jgi:hypothetical protein
MKFSKLILISFLSLLQVSAMGAEVDQFTRSDEFLADSSALLNINANQSISQAIKLANAEGKGCREEVLYDELKEYFANHTKGKFVIDLIENPAYSKRHIEVKDSIFQDWTIWDGVGLGFTMLSSNGVTMSDIIRVGDEEVGVDKFEHMFGQGFKYFNKNYLQDKGEIDAVKQGIFREKFLLGGQKIGNGVFSYGDLSANFNGMRFWNHVLQKHNDVLGADRNLGPYVSCVNDKWVKAKEIDFRNYIDSSLNESINCSKYPSGNTLKKLKNRLKIMGVTCPMNQQKLDDVHVKYRQMAKWIINMDGPGEVKYFREFKNK